MEVGRHTKLFMLNKRLCATAFILLVLISAFSFYTNINAAAVRGISGDFWADTILGKRDFTEMGLNKIVDYEVFNPGGVTIDNSVEDGRMYVWDSGNNRILGLNLGDLDGSPYHADIVIGQPSGTDWGACNQDGSFQNDPNSSIPNASTLCGIPDYTHTTGEHKTFSNMFVDSSGNLYVPDIFNNRVLKYNSPFTTDTIADEVWGQPNFSGQRCNLTTQRFEWPLPAPTAASICFSYWDGAGGGGAVIDSEGNLWIADSLNNRVLRFPSVEGTISKTANLVLGQSNFTTGPEAGGSAINKLSAPQSVRFDDSGKLYVADSGNNRVIVFTPPFTTGMNGSVFLSSSSFEEAVQGLEFSIDKTRLYTLSNPGPVVDEWDLAGNYIQEVGGGYNWGGGSIGVDLNDNVYLSDYIYGQHVYQFVRQINDSYEIGITFFHDEEGIGLRMFNEVAADRSIAPAGIKTIDDRVYVADGRLLFWDNKDELTNGQAPDGYLNSTSFTDLPNQNYRCDSQIQVDEQGRLWAAANNFYEGGRVDVFFPPINSEDTPDLTINGTIPLVGGGSITIGMDGENSVGFNGIEVSDDAQYLWITETNRHRVIRIKDPLTNPVVDVILGQVNSTGKTCNRGLSGYDWDANPTYLCLPSYLSFDNFGNLYVSDHFFEWDGNYRLLMFTANTFPDDLTSVLYAPAAKKAFPAASFEVTFDEENTMVLGTNPYTGNRYLRYYNNPQNFNPSNPFDIAFNTYVGTLNDFYGWPIGLEFDEEGNLYVGDGNRGKILIYDRPFNISNTPPVLTQVTPVPTPTIDSTPNCTFNSTKAGTISYGGSYSSTTTIAITGNNTITFNHLADGTYSNCTITVSDNLDNSSNVLNVSAFTITARAHFLRTKGDFNTNGKIDLSDLSILATYWLQVNAIADANLDGVTNISDLSILATYWLQNFS